MLNKRILTNPALVAAAQKRFDYQNEIIDRHVANLFFHVEIIRSFPRKTQLAVSLRDDLVVDHSNVQSLLPSIIDCAASVASHGLVGPASVTESETYFFPVSLGRDFIVRMEIEVSNKPFITYSCQIFQQEKRSRVPVLESHGTLCASPVGNNINALFLLAEDPAIL